MDGGDVSRETWPSVDPGTFRRLLGRQVTDEVLERLRAHYDTLRQWSRTLALVGPEHDGPHPVVRHYAESLAGLDHLPSTSGSAVLDLGSGAGFPGLVLAAARPDLDVTLVESRQRKCAFLSTVARKSRLSVECLDVRVSGSLSPRLPRSVSVVTLRAIRFPVPVLSALSRRYPGAVWLWWAGPRDVDVPPGWELAASTPLAGSSGRRILKWSTP